jgi:hypothetical protein
VGDAVAVGGVGGVFINGGGINFERQQTGVVVEVYLFCFGSRVVVEHARKEKKENTHSKICCQATQAKINEFVFKKILKVVFGFI